MPCVSGLYLLRCADLLHPTSSAQALATWASRLSCPLQGAGDRAFCAGGDVKTVVQLGQAGRMEEALRCVSALILQSIMGCWRPREQARRWAAAWQVGASMRDEVQISSIATVVVGQDCPTSASQVLWFPCLECLEESSH